MSKVPGRTGMLDLALQKGETGILVLEDRLCKGEDWIRAITPPGVTVNMCKSKPFDEAITPPGVSVDMRNSPI